MTTREKIEQKIEDVQYQIDNFEIDESQYEEEFDDMLDDTNYEVFGIEPSRILKECDPIAYNLELSYYIEGIDLNSIEDYNDLEAELYDLQDELNDLDEEE